MQTLSQTRMQNLLINHRRNKIKLIIISLLTLALVITAVLLYGRIRSIITEVTEEYTHYITEAHEEMLAADARRSASKAAAAELRAQIDSITAEIEALRGSN